MKPEIAIIAGFDSSGGAGLLADGETVRALGAKPRFVMTALTAQTDEIGLSVESATDSILRSQLKAAFAEVSPKAVKVGMLPNREIAAIVADELKARSELPVVFDPALESTSGLSLMDEDCVQWVLHEFFSHVSLVTPNLDEARRFTGANCATRADMIRAAERFLSFGAPAVLVKGGHLVGELASDCLLRPGEEPVWFECPRAEGSFRGTGCRLSSAIATRLAFGDDLHEAVGAAKAHITDYLSDRAG